jgi:drug/metabolite transporter (DMT)-like permease
LPDWKIYSAVVFVCVALGSFLYKRARILGANPGSFMVVQAFTFLAAVSAVGLLSGRYSFENPYLGLGLLCGVFGATGALTTLISMGKGELGTNISVVRLSFVPTTLGAILFLGEELTFRKGLLFLSAAAAVFLFVDHYRKENRQALGSLVPALTACLAFGVFDLIYKVASSHGVSPIAFLMVQSATGNILINLYVAVFEKYRINGVILRLAPVCGLLFATACLAWLRALQDVDVSLVVPFIQMNFILTYILGVLFLGESVSVRKLLGLGLVALSILLLWEQAFRWISGIWEMVVGP